jgi:hypothetical protein
MITTLTGLYLKLNILLLAGFVLWQALKWLAATLDQSLRFRLELRLARLFFLLVLSAPLLFVLSDSMSETAICAGCWLWKYSSRCFSGTLHGTCG